MYGIIVETPNMYKEAKQKWVMLCYLIWNLFTVGSLQFRNDSAIASLEANQNQPNFRNIYTKMPWNTAAPKLFNIPSKISMQKHYLDTDTAGDMVAYNFIKAALPSPLPPTFASWYPPANIQKPKPLSRITSNDYLILLPSLPAPAAIIITVTTIFTLLLIQCVTHH